MPSPFPGMDPWLEWPGVFPDLHSTYIGYIREALSAQLRPPFYSAISTRVWMENSERYTEPDLDLLRSGDTRHSTGNGGVATATGWATGLLEIEGPLPDEEMTETFVEIYSAPGNAKLVTSIEVLSPSNKRPGSGGRDLYRAKQQEMLLGGVNLVEIDFLRTGTHTTLVPLSYLRRQSSGAEYHICVHSPDKPRSYYLALIHLADRLPTIPIPLVPDMPPLRLDCQAVLDKAYEIGSYERRIRYDEPCDPALTPEQQSWAEGILLAKGILK